jgi:HSP20 family protein
VGEEVPAGSTEYELAKPRVPIAAHDQEIGAHLISELPGVDEKDVTVTIANGLLTIRGEKKDQHEEKDATHYFSERSFGAFERSLGLPDTIDEAKVEATFDKGVL